MVTWIDKQEDPKKLASASRIEAIANVKLAAETQHVGIMVDRDIVANYDNPLRLVAYTSSDVPYGEIHEIPR
jgi:hypothetical protein